MVFSQIEVAKALASSHQPSLVVTLHEIAQAGEAVAAEMGYADFVAKFVGSNEAEVVAAAIAAMGGMGSIGAAYAGTVAEQLTHRSPAVRVAACQALGSFGEAAGDFTFKLSSLVSDDSEASVKAAAIPVLAALASDVDVIKTALKSSSSEVAGAACEALGWLGEISEEDLTANLADATTSLSALKALSSMGQKAYVSCLNEVVEKGLKNPVAANREQAIAVIGNLQQAALLEPTLGQILDCCNSPVVAVRVASALALAAMGESVAAMGEEAAGGVNTPLGVLQGLLVDADEDTSGLALVVGTAARRPTARCRKPKCAAIYAIGRMRGLWSLRSKDINDWLNDADWEVRLCTLEMLACFRKVSSRKGGDVTVVGLKSVVVNLLCDSAYPVRAKAIACLGIWHAEESCDEIVSALQDTAPDVREAAATALSMLGECAHEHCHEVFKLFNDKSACCRATAIKCLASMGELGQNYAPVIATMMNEDDLGVRIAAIEALGSMGPTGAAFSEDIGDHLYLGAPAERSAAKLAMAKLGQVPAEVTAPTQLPEDKPALYASILAAERAKMGLKH